MAKAEVLVVEDDDDIRNLTCEFLELEGISSSGVANGQCALKFLREENQKPKVILLDLMMPELDATAFREQQLLDPKISTIPCVLMTAHGAIDKKCQELGMETFIKKPIDIEDLLRIVRRFL